MTNSAEILSAARDLAPAERLDLVEQLLDSLDRPDALIDAMWAREAEDRLAAYRAGGIETLPLSDVLAKYGAK
jgi:putative addiction module component (TIGR02574 family)